MLEKEPREESGKQGDSILDTETVEMILARAKENLLRDDSLVPALFVRFSNDEKAIFALTGLPDTYVEKQAYFTALGRSIQLSGRRIHEALFVSESWIVSAKKDQGLAPDIKPSQHPDRKEAITIVGRNAQKTRHTVVIQPFSRDIELMPVFEKIDIAECNAPTREKDLRAIGLTDYLFPHPIATQNWN